MNRLLSFTLSLLLANSLIHSDEDEELTRNSDETEVPYTPPPQAVIESELEQAERDYQAAKEMFNPWYTGPLITGSANNAPPGTGIIQPYFYVIDTFATYDNHRHSTNIPSIVTLNPLYLFQTGITTWLDTTVIVQGVFNEQSGIWGSNVGDTSWGIGLQLRKETPYGPGIRLSISETFPTGKYDYLDPKKNGLDATGAGSYQTSFTLALGKVIWWNNPLHPMSVRFNAAYTAATVTDVHNFNAYGGGYGTDGKVNPGNSLNFDFGLEYSLTQRWVAALDVVYEYFNKASFSGIKGVDSQGMPASIGAPSGDQLSFAPAIEYNPSDSFGYIAGIWFTATGRNAGRFVSGIFSFYAAF